MRGGAPACLTTPTARCAVTPPHEEGSRHSSIEEAPTMIGSFVLVLLGAAVATTPCENLKTLKLSNTTITGAEFVPEGPAPQRGGNRGGAQAARGGAAAPQAQ